MLRQAFSYIQKDKLDESMHYFYEALNSWWKLIFNTFELIPDKEYQNRDFVTKSWTKKIINHEWNLIRDWLLYHGQKSHIFWKDDWSYEHCYDLNVFTVFEKDEILEAGKNAWFDVDLIHFGQSLYFVCTKWE